MKQLLQAILEDSVMPRYILGWSKASIHICLYHPPTYKYRFGASPFSMPAHRQTFGEGACGKVGKNGRML
jgi:hypothetical protein